MTDERCGAVVAGRIGPKGATITLCGHYAKLYPSGWRCDDHAPSPNQTAGDRTRRRSNP